MLYLFYPMKTYFIIIAVIKRFNLANVMRLSDSIPLGCPYPDDYLYARPYPDQRSSRGWLVDMINKFVLSQHIYIYKSL